MKITRKEMSCLKAMLNVAHTSGDNLKNGWPVILDALEYLDVVLRVKPSLVDSIV